MYIEQTCHYSLENGIFSKEMREIEIALYFGSLHDYQRDCCIISIVQVIELTMMAIYEPI
jgi:hypothetical protein